MTFISEVMLYSSYYINGTRQEIMERMKKYFKLILKKFGKRITNYHSPAKPYVDGVAFLKGFINKPDWIIDVGAADGTLELTTSFPLGAYNYLLIDANPHFGADLDSVKQKYQDTVVVEKCFCGEEEKKIPFYISKSKTGHTAGKYLTGGEKEVIEVEVKTLDSLAEKHSIQGSVLMKIDVEGAELDVLKGATKTLTLCDVVIMEAWINVSKESSGDFAALVAYMKENSFVMFDIFGGHNYKNGVLALVDVVFVKEDSPYRTLR